MGDENKMRFKQNVLRIICVVIVLCNLFTISGCSQECNEKDLEECDGKCSVCPPCEACSSISCQTTEYCESIGFSNEWYDEIKAQRSLFEKRK